MLQLKRSEAFIKRNCKVIGSALVAASNVSVIIPVTLESANLLSIEERFYTVGCMMYTNGKEYAVMNLAATIELGITDYRKMMVIGFDGEEVECYEFLYEKGDRIHPTNEVPVNAQLAYSYVNHHILMGKSVPFFSEDDVDALLDSIPRFCKFGLPEYGYLNHFTEMILRDAENIRVPSRLSKNKAFTTIPYSSVVLNVSSIIGKNRGGYLEDGLMSSTITTSKASTPFEKVMRS